MRNVTIQIPDELYDYLTFISNELKQSKDHILHTAVKHYVSELIEDIKAYKEIMKDLKQTDASSYREDVEREYNLK